MLCFWWWNSLTTWYKGKTKEKELSYVWGVFPFKNTLRLFSEILSLVRVPRQLLVSGGSGFLVGWRSQSSGGLVAVGGGWRGCDVPLRGSGAVLTAFHQVRPLRKGRTPLLVRPTGKTNASYSMLQLGSYVVGIHWYRAACLLFGSFKIQRAMRLLKD